MKDFKGALTSYAKAIESNPNKPLYHRNKGTSLSTLKDYTEAIKSFDVVTKLDTINAYAHNGKGDCLVKLETYAAAVEEYAKACEIQPQNEKYKDDMKNAIELS